MENLTPKVQKKRVGRPRKWIKLHIAIDARAQEIVSEMTTASCVDDGKAFPNVISQVFGYPKIVIRDGAYDDREIRKLIRKKGGKALAPPPSNAVCRGIDPDPVRAILDIRALGGDKKAKSIWGKFSGYSKRSLIETTFSRYKKMFGERAFSRTWARLPLENRLKCIFLNKMRRAAI